MCRSDVQRRCACGKPFRASRKPFRDRAKTVRLPAGITVRLQPGILFVFTPERFRVHPGILFALPRNPQSVTWVLAPVRRDLSPASTGHPSEAPDPRGQLHRLRSNALGYAGSALHRSTHKSPTGSRQGRSRMTYVIPLRSNAEADSARSANERQGTPFGPIQTFDCKLRTNARLCKYRADRSSQRVGRANVASSRKELPPDTGRCTTCGSKQPNGADEIPSISTVKSLLTTETCDCY